MQYQYYIYLAAAQAIYNFILRCQGIRSAAEFRDILCTCKLGAAKYDERVGPVNQLQWTLSLESLDLPPFRTSKNCFSSTFEMQSALISSFSSWQYFAELIKCHMYTWFCSAIWLVPPDKALEVDNFSFGCYQALSSPHFLRREPGDEASCTPLSEYPKIPRYRDHSMSCKGCLVLRCLQLGSSFLICKKCAWLSPSEALDCLLFNGTMSNWSQTFLICWFHRSEVTLIS